jgi:pantoate--beta-alanine ligase
VQLKIISSISEMQAASEVARSMGQRIGFVPTMGYLHEGHAALIRRARLECDVVVVSVYVNPTQFAPTEDFSKYPRSLDHDIRIAEEAGCAILFTPESSEIYPEQFSTYVQVDNLSSVLEGTFRPTHFKGVTTIVAILFLIVHPHQAYFGQKDAQQSVVIKQMVRDLHFNLEIVVVPTVRENDGLAKSSRNVYLTERERADAVVLYKALQKADEMIKNGERASHRIVGSMTQMITAKPNVVIDYISIVDGGTLELIETLKPGTSVLIPLAARFGATRLIDNIVVSVPSFS